MQEEKILERLVAVEERSKSNTKRINEAEARLNEKGQNMMARMIISAINSHYVSYTGGFNI